MLAPNAGDFRAARPSYLHVGVVAKLGLNFSELGLCNLSACWPASLWRLGACWPLSLQREPGVIRTWWMI
jgi:hypothetical protein